MALITSRQNWFIKYKLYHIPFWVLYNYLFWAFQIDSPSEAAHEIFFSAYAAKCLFYVLFPAFAVYFNLYFLVPHYLQKRRYGWYLLLLALTVMASAALIVPGYYVTAWLADSNAKDMFGLTNWKSFYHLAKSDPLKNTIAAITLGMSIKLAKNWIETQRRHQALEKEKLETELKFLKYQFNPHFLFNSINSIFFLIHKNPAMASDSLAKFSELLRYQLYECNDPQITLDRELVYLENFIELEKLRQNKLEVSTDLDCGQAAAVSIAPFILMTFVENAFKHVSKEAHQVNFIRIHLKMAGENLDFSVANSYSGPVAEAVKYAGIGLQNVRRRLDLLYPGGYALAISQSPELFEVRLQLTLTQTENYAAELYNS